MLGHSVAIPNDRWRFFTDAVMGGVSAGRADLGHDESYSHVRMTGVVSTANRGGFIQIQRRLDAPLAADISSVWLTVRGNGEGYFVHLRSMDAPFPTAFWRAAFATSQDWQDIDLPLNAFAPSLPGLPLLIASTRISAVAVVAYGRDHEVDVSVADVGFQ